MNHSFYNILMTTIFVGSMVLCIAVMLSKYGRFKIHMPEQRKEIPFPNWLYTIFCIGTGSGCIALLPDYVHNYAQADMGITQVYLLWTIPVWALTALMGLFYMRYYKTRTANVINIIALILGCTVAIPATVSAICNFYGIETSIQLVVLVAVIILGVTVLSIKNMWFNNIGRLNLAVFGLLTLALFTNIKEPFINPIEDLIKILRLNRMTAYNEMQNINSTIIYCSWVLCCSVFTGRMLAYYSNGMTLRNYFLRTILVPSMINSIWIIAVQVSGFHIHTAIKDTPFIGVLVLLSLVLFQITSMDSVVKTIIKDTNRYLPREKSGTLAGIQLGVILLVSIIVSMLFDRTIYSYTISFIMTPVILVGFINAISMVLNLVNYKELKSFLDCTRKTENKNG